MSDYNKGLLPGLLVAQVFLTGCTHGYAETIGDEPEPDWLDPPPSGPPASQYSVPSTNPKGTAYVVSLEPQALLGPGGRHEPFLNLRIAVENATDPIPWTLDPRDMKVNFDSASSALPEYASAAPAGPPLTIPEGKRGNLDLYFPLGMASRPRYVDFLWQIHRGGKTDTFSTRLELLNGPTEADVYYRPTYTTDVDFAYGPGWWWGPDQYWAEVQSPWWWWWGGGAFVGPRFAGYQGRYYGGGFHSGSFHGGGFHGGGFHGGGGHR